MTMTEPTKTKTKESTTGNSTPAAFSWAVPEELGVPPDPLRLRLDFHHQAVQMTYYNGDAVENKMVSAADVATALANELSFTTGLLPDNTLWWRNTRSGPVHTLYVPAHIQKVALQVDIGKPAERFTIPLPPLIFLCKPNAPPWVFAVKRKPTKETDRVYHAPLLNIFADGRSCPGSHKYPFRVQETVESFFLAFFTSAGDRPNRSKKHPRNILELWKELDGKRSFPLDDLQEWGVLQDMLRMRLD